MGRIFLIEIIEVMEIMGHSFYPFIDLTENVIVTLCKNTEILNQTSHECPDFTALVKALIGQSKGSEIDTH